MSELVAALCLVAVLEGLFLFAAPRGWKQAVAHLQALPDRQLRLLGGLVAAAGVLSLWLARG
ncbi:DUF2065 domain-containing protein [Lysobacter sp. A3-1-A15]|uniref:DUF2065 domain-containing protein n=1 Tax=Novilysobacter viscosus TaxID=3098602 RepID=UPI002EDB7743